uniref:Uncharacterized protein n=1 Tax=Vespula pensylvanica TaxID=30213 RepID=A0A834P2Q0_VESPE|nr:hypothetical protein H0235_008040 [Vespula pensylvanica]
MGRMLLIMQRTSEHSVQIKKRIILFIILGQNAHPASINEDFKQYIQKDVDLPVVVVHPSNDEHPLNSGP